MKTTLLGLVLLLCFTSSAQDQIEARNIIYLEAGGFGGLGSFNYERTAFSQSNFQIGARIGLGFNKMKDFRNTFNPDIAVPIAACFTYGRNFKGEINIGTTYTNNVTAGPELSVVRSTAIHGALAAGFRYQRMNKGLFLRLGYSPLFEKFSSIRHWGYLSIGLTL